MHDIEYIIGAPEYGGFTWKCDCGRLGESLEYVDALDSVRAHIRDWTND